MSTQKVPVALGPYKVLGLLSLAYLLGQARADGVPASPLFYYHGRLIESGAPVNEARDFSLTVHDAPAASGNPDSTKVCGPYAATNVPVKDGHFTLEIPDECRRQVHSHADLYIALTVEGEAMTGRTKLGAVPYAVEAARADNGNPPGTVIAWSGVAADRPNGWLLCDGAGYSAQTHPDLFAAIKTAWGDGTAHCAGSSCDFNVPDLRGRFLRGADSGAYLPAGPSGQMRDPGAAARVMSNPGGNAGDSVGTLQADAMKRHSHTLTWKQWDFGNGPGGTGRQFFMPYEGSATSTTSIAGEDDHESRPANAAVLFLVRCGVGDACD